MGLRDALVVRARMGRVHAQNGSLDTREVVRDPFVGASRHWFGQLGKRIRSMGTVERCSSEAGVVHAADGRRHSGGPIGHLPQSAIGSNAFNRQGSVNPHTLPSPPEFDSPNDLHL